MKLTIIFKNGHIFRQHYLDVVNIEEKLFQFEITVNSPVGDMENRSLIHRRETIQEIKLEP